MRGVGGRITGGERTCAIACWCYTPVAPSGMVDTPDGSAPEAGALAPYLDWIVEASRGELPPIAFLELDPLIDSANATPGHGARSPRDAL